MSFYCPHCNAENGVGYEWAGMTLPCAACLQAIKLEYRLGQRIAQSGCAITFTDFCQLVNDVDTSRTVHPLIADLLDCTLENFGGRFALRHKGGALIPLEVAHFTIQADAVKQNRIYNMAMTLWR